MPVVLDGTEWWTSDDCAHYIGITAASWRFYVARSRRGTISESNPAPQPEARAGAVALWRPSDVQAWNAQRRGRGFWREKAAKT